MNKRLISSRTHNISSFIVMDVLEKAQAMEAEGREIIHLEIGEPDFPTPAPVKDAVMKAVRDNDTHYTHSLGKYELREEIARYHFEQYGAKISPDQVIVTSGTSPAMLLIFSVLLEKGEQVILSDPYYACYPNFIRYVQGEPVFVPVYEKDGFKYRPDNVKKYINDKTRAILINSPANPTGVVLSNVDLQALADLGQTIISDEIYHGLIYEGEQHSILEYTDDAFVINGFSKLFAMTGWRLGYVISPPEYVGAMQKLQQNLFICASSFAQTAAITALKDCEQEIAAMRTIYNERRLYLLERLKNIGIATAVEPTGAFYALANVKKFTDDSYSFAFKILENANVAVTPGIDFGSNCEGYIRLSYANSLENIKKGMDQLELFLKNYSD